MVFTVELPSLIPPRSTSGGVQVQFTNFDSRSILCNSSQLWKGRLLNAVVHGEVVHPHPHGGGVMTQEVQAGAVSALSSA